MRPGYVDIRKHKGVKYPDARINDLVVGLFNEVAGEWDTCGYLVIRWSDGVPKVCEIEAYNAIAAMKCKSLFLFLVSSPRIAKKTLMIALETKGYLDLTVKYRIVDLFSA